MTNTQNGTFAINRFRVAVFVLACVLGTLATWILVAEVLRPKEIEFTTDAKSAASAYARRDRALKAALIGLVRGDLWSEAAFAYGDVLWTENKMSNSDVPFDQIMAVTEQAIFRAPCDSRLWLLLAANYRRFDWLNERAAASLRMSFYTGANLMEVVPERLLLATQSHALQDDDFRELVRHDIEIAVRRRSELVPALLGAYKEASAAGRQLIEKVVAELDPAMLTLIRGDKS